MMKEAVLPGPKGHFITGNFNEFNQDPLTFLLDQRQYGDLSRFSAGPFSVTVVGHPELIHDVLVTNADKYLKTNKKMMQPIIGNGILINDGEDWKRQRRLMQPVFHTKRIGAYGDVMVNYAKDIADGWQDGTIRNIDDDMNTLTMRIVSKTLFDADVTKEPSEIVQKGQLAMALLEESFQQMVPIPMWVPTRHNRQLKDIVVQFDALIQRFIDDRRASSEEKGDLLSLLLMARDEDNTSMTDKQVRDEAKTLFGAGLETTAVNMMWLWYALSQNPAVEAKLHEELDRVLNGRLPTIDDLKNLPYTEQVVKESNRLYSPSFVITRDVKEEVTLGGHQLKPGQTVLISIYSLHRDARFFPDPERFDPERFSPENENTIPKYAYLPFGTGPRVCIGNAFAHMEARLLLATLAQRVTLSLAPGCKVVPARRFTLRPKDSLRMIVKTRK